MMQHKDIASLFQQLFNLNNNNRAILKTVITTLLTVKNYVEKIVETYKTISEILHSFAFFISMILNLKEYFNISGISSNVVVRLKTIENILVNPNKFLKIINLYFQVSNAKNDTKTSSLSLV